MLIWVFGVTVASRSSKPQGTRSNRVKPALIKQFITI